MAVSFLFSILLNLINTWLVYILVFLVQKRRSRAIITAIIFLVHPFLWSGLGEGSSQQKGLFLSFFLLAFIFFDTNPLYYLNSLSLFLLALLFSREALILPFLMLLYNYHFSEHEEAPLKKYLPFFEVLGLFLAFQYIFFAPSLIPVSRANDILTTISYIPATLLYCFTLTPGLSTSAEISLFEYLFYGAIALFFILASIKLYRLSRELSFISLWFFLSLSCTIYLTLSWEPHNYYLPLVGASWFAGWVLFQLWSCRYLFIKCLAFLSFFSITGFYLIANTVQSKQPIMFKPEARPFISPDLADYHFFLAHLYEQEGDYTQALKENNLALRLNPSAVHPHLGLGIVYNKLGQYDQAIKELQEVLKVFPYHLYALNWLGDIYKKLGKWEKAKEQYLKAIIFDPDDVVARNNLGAIYLREGNPAEAKLHFQRVLKIDPSDGVAKTFLQMMEMNK